LTLIKGHCGILLRRQAQGLPVDPADLTRRLEAISGAADRTVVAFESEEHPGDDDPHPS
jgi:hypothetical protein